MDNSTRSERTRQAGIQAALTIISRDGPKQLTFDAMARESRISKGGLMHQFPNKEAVLKALIDHQIDYFERFSKGFLAAAHQSAEQNLAAQLATWREAVTTPANITTAVLVAQLEDPSLLAGPLDSSKESARTIAAQATDPDLSLLRWTAARGLVLSAMLGLCPFSDEERARLFDRLQDDSQWPAIPSNAVR
ncbi:TetR/AcrR family transcriptional regulator [Ralstonia solanacearum]|uniref:Putative transcription regulator protein, TetR-like protein n=1 Tax=Ralstonia solanacearum (strain Po82) TaxID=1031711 RepID=F6G1B0_RALS8|nr:TetR/AcrR family transcriptional regulator [Ralstonia solanacearum]AEG68914.1 putative transcription regulator protein, TetR-like protein [Ralstonia solanacearum Po82]AMP70727.1 transcriptional regulator [Ralstonia solanacearum]AMP73006.1 transcriptional regulator [Ralstonia solanacearum]AYB60497.1 TetR/AcrR family transcriptional regulator [Ralstonia solanacearum]EUJ15068.1 TetR family transcriptional regulator [Ralstonia solanacearum P673]